MENEIVEKPDYVEELVNLIRSGESDEGISEKIDNYHDNDIASALDELNEKERKKLYQILGVERMSEIFAYVDDVGKYLEEIELEKAADIISEAMAREFPGRTAGMAGKAKAGRAERPREV